GKSENADFSTITDATNALKCGGVSGPVTFLLEDGTYNERVVLSSIPGASAFNNVTFESKSGNNAEAIISYGSGDATVIMNGVAYVSFENLTIDHKTATYGNCLRVDGKSNNLNFKGVVFEGVEVNRAGSNSAVVYFSSTAPKTDINIEDCEINNGSTGLVKGGANGENLDTKTSITGTLFFNQYESGLALTNEDAPVITNNVVSTLSTQTGFRAINLDNVANNVIVSNNIVNAANGSYGLAMNNCSAQGTNLGQINNNSIAVGGTSESYGIYLSGTTDNQVLNFNRVKLTINGQQSATQAYYRNAGTGNNVNLMNNIFYDLNSGGYTIIGNTYKDFFNQLPGQSNPSLSVSSNGLMIEKVTPIK
ncbi:MAG: hypothetical protein RLZZ367_36, partial [Bacteroidota bacterium]